MTTLEFIPVPIKVSPTEVDVLTINKNASPYITKVEEEPPNEVVQISNSSDIYKIIGIVVLAGLIIYALRTYDK